MVYDQYLTLNCTVSLNDFVDERFDQFLEYYNG